jgi:hypothetical protein
MLDGAPYNYNGPNWRCILSESRANEDLLEARQRYFEKYAFPLFSHIDFRVSDAQAVRPFYDPLLALCGTEATTVRVARYGYTRRYGSVRADFFNVYEDPQACPTAMRIALAVPSRAFVDEVARVYANTALVMSRSRLFRATPPNVLRGLLRIPARQSTRSVPPQDG